MATLNLGNIKLNWKGAYSGGTAYVVDDVVSYSGSSYICKLASTGNLPTDGTYWDQVASAGTNGTDLTSTLTTQGDILYRDGSGLARLGYGTSGKVLTTKGSGQNPAWETASGGKVLQYIFNHDNTEVAVNVGTTPNFAMGSRLDLAITPSATSSKILVMYNFGSVCSYEGSNLGYGRISVSNDGFSSNETIPVSGGANQNANHYSHFGLNLQTSDHQTHNGLCCSFIHSPNSTSAQTYRPKFWTESGTGYIYINRSPRDNANDFSSVCFAYAMELEG